jgi:hypothetical protein
MLYTNWAAVDLLRQLRFKNSNKAFQETGHASSASIAAAFNVTYWGVLHIGLCANLDLVISDTVTAPQAPSWTRSNI